MDSHSIKQLSQIATKLFDDGNDIPDVAEKLQSIDGQLNPNKKMFEDTIDALMFTSHLYTSWAKLIAERGEIRKKLTSSHPISKDIYDPYPDMKISKKGEVLYPKVTKENIKELMRRIGAKCHYDVIKKDNVLSIPDGKTYVMDDAKNAIMAEFLSVATRANFPTLLIPEMVASLCAENAVNFVLNWITSKKWDGVSRLEDFYATVVHNEDEASEDLKKLLMRKWLIQAVAALKSPQGLNAQGVLVFQGQQRMGKSRWCQKLLPKELSQYLMPEQAVVPREKDNVHQTVGHWIVELAELDTTFSRSDIGSLKAFITKPYDTLRLPYARTHSQFPRRTVFYASVNQKDFLIDHTGNGRFWVIPVIQINPDHDIDMQQLWAEINELHELGEKHWLEKEELELLAKTNRAFEQTSTIEEKIAKYFDWSKPLRDDAWYTATEVLEEFADLRVGLSEKRQCAVALLKLNGGISKLLKGYRHYKLPEKLAKGVVESTKSGAENLSTTWNYY